MKINDLLIDNTSKQVLSIILNRSIPEIVLNKEDKISFINYLKYKKIINGLNKGKALQYLTKQTYFYEYSFYVNKNVLIPRPETEILVDITNKFINEYFNKDISILDVGTGSGNIAITLKKLNENSKVTAIDISNKALKVARKNAKLNNVDITFIKSNLLNNINNKYDVLISNPPYIDKENDFVEEIVLNNEPHLALFAPNKGLDNYIKILKESKKVLNNKNIIAFEIGDKQKEDLIKIVKEYYADSIIKAYKDNNNLDRILIVLNNIDK